jgi:hypothetical protein
VAGGNLVSHGELGLYKHKHTSGFHLKNEVARAIGAYNSYAVRLQKTIEHLKNEAYTVSTMHAMFFAAFLNILPCRLYDKAVQELMPCIEAHGTTRWALYNVFSRVAMDLGPAPHYKALIKLGEMFTHWS